jgi:hypothetical protein
MNRARAIAAVAIIVLASPVPACNRNEPITQDEACELLIERELRQEFGMWAARFHYRVVCAPSDGDREIVVTITPANGQQDLRHDFALMEKMARAAGTSRSSGTSPRVPQARRVPQVRRSFRASIRSISVPHPIRTRSVAHL